MSVNTDFWVWSAGDHLSIFVLGEIEDLTAVVDKSCIWFGKHLSYHFNEPVIKWLNVYSGAQNSLTLLFIVLCITSKCCFPTPIFHPPELLCELLHSQIWFFFQEESWAFQKGFFSKKRRVFVFDFWSSSLLQLLVSVKKCGKKVVCIMIIINYINY